MQRSSIKSLAAIIASSTAMLTFQDHVLGYPIPACPVSYDGSLGVNIYYAYSTDDISRSIASDDWRSFPVSRERLLVTFEHPMSQPSVEDNGVPYLQEIPPHEKPPAANPAYVYVPDTLEHLVSYKLDLGDHLATSNVTFSIPWNLTSHLFFPSTPERGSTDLGSSKDLPGPKPSTVVLFGIAVILLAWGLKKHRSGISHTSS